jgi:hypothetical protein
MRTRFKHGLILVQCFCSNRQNQYKCKKCKDFGEYWLTVGGAVLTMCSLKKTADRSRQAIGTQRDVGWGLTEV